MQEIKQTELNFISGGDSSFTGLLNTTITCTIVGAALILGTGRSEPVFIPIIGAGVYLTYMFTEALDSYFYPEKQT